MSFKASELVATPSAAPSLLAHDDAIPDQASTASYVGNWVMTR
jgi:hypothetical protein